jgi:hypothetical protein
MRIILIIGLRHTMRNDRANSIIVRTARLCLHIITKEFPTTVLPFGTGDELVVWISPRPTTERWGGGGGDRGRGGWWRYNNCPRTTYEKEEIPHNTRYIDSPTAASRRLR